MLIDTGQYSIADLFHQVGVIEVPKYQRTYAWQSSQIIDFRDDIQNCLHARLEARRVNQFFGSIICARSSMPNSLALRYEVIDGQQRLSSFVMLVAAMVDSIENLLMSDSASSSDANAVKSLNYIAKKARQDFLEHKYTKGLKPFETAKMTLSESDNDYFQKVLDDETSDGKEIAEMKSKNVRKSHLNILEARVFLRKFIASELSGKKTLEEKCEVLKHLFCDVLTKDCTVIFMWSDDRMEAYRIFQVLNNRGARLRDGDLLRAITLEMLDDKQFTNQQNELAKNWNEMLKYSPNTVDEYLLWYFSSYEGYRPKLTEVTDQFMEVRFKQKPGVIATSKAVATNAVAEVSQMKQDFQAMDQLVNGDWPYKDQNGVTKWDVSRLGILVKRLDQTSVLPLLLALKLLGPKKFTEALVSIERFIFRYKTTVSAHIDPARHVFYKQAKAIRANQSTYNIDELRKELGSLLDKYASENVFTSKIREFRLSNHRDKRSIKYMLLTIEDYYDWASSSHGKKADPVCKSKSTVFDIDSLTLEHIYPQNPQKGEECKKLNDLTDHLGNLTLLGPEDNSEMGNLPFSKKRSEYKNSRLKLSQEIGKKRKWDFKAVNKRTDELIEMAVKIFVP